MFIKRNAPDLGEHTPKTLNALAQIRYTKHITIQITVINQKYTQWIYVDRTLFFSDLVRWSKSKRKTTAATSFASFCRQAWMNSADDEVVCRWRLSGDELGEPRFQLRLRWVATRRMQELSPLRRQTCPRKPSSLPPASMPATKHAGSRARPREMQSPARGRKRRKFPHGGWWIRRANSARWAPSTFRVSGTSSIL
jgi:hypothetical protein